MTKPKPGPLRPIPQPVIHQGRSYSGHYRTLGGDVVIFQQLATKQASSHSETPAQLAQQLGS